MSAFDGEPAPRSKWSTAWYDAAAFAAGLALAWYQHWETKDLIWSLWLSSLLVGYAMILWMIFRPGLFLAFNAWRDRGRGEPVSPARIAGLGAAYLFGALFLVGFFTVHFGMFHFVHSAFLSIFFPVDGSTPGQGGALPGLKVYGAVFLAYWPFVLIAAVAERQAFRWPGAKSLVGSDPAVTPEAIAARKARNALSGGMSGMMAPYRNVIRLHLLIFFFAFAHYAHIDTFAVYAVVYGVYFFPWRLLRRSARGPL